MATPAQPPHPPPHRPRHNRPLPNPVTLAEHLAACYAASHGFAPASAKAAFCKAVQSDKALAAQAEERYQQLETLRDACQGDIKKRCVLSAAHYDALKAALGK